MIASLPKAGNLSNFRLDFCRLKGSLHDIGDPPIFFQGEMVPWQYLHIRRSKAGGMHLINFQELQTRKELKRPAARLTGTVLAALSRPFISLEKKWGGLRCHGVSTVIYTKIYPEITEGIWKPGCLKSCFSGINLSVFSVLVL
jgi:hypothetical protein